MCMWSGAALVCLMCVNAVFGENGSSQRPNIIVILADDLGWNDVSFHGSNQIPTPHINKLVHEGIFLNNYYVSPICTPTRGALMTGRHPMQLGLQRSVIVGDAPWGLGLNETILPQYLKDLGYATHCVGKWHLGFFGSELTPLNRGFDSYYGYYLGAEDYLDHTAWAQKGYQGLDFRDGYNLDKTADKKYSTELFTTRAQKIIDNHNINQPLFMYLPHQAVHSGNPASTGVNPLEAPKKYTDRFPHITDPNRKIFAGMVSALDDSIGNLTQTLQSRGLLDNTIIIFSTDNGGPAAGFDMNHANNWPLRGVKATYWEGGMRGAGFVWSRLLNKPARISDDLIHVADWLPTLLHVAGANSTYNRSELYGKNVWDTLSNGEASPRDEIIHNYDRKSGAIRQGDWKLIVIGPEWSYTKDWPSWYKPESANISNMNTTVRCAERDHSLPECTDETSPCLFNVRVDPCEFNNIAEKYPDRVKNMLKRLLDVASRSQAPRNCPTERWASPVYHGHAWVPWIKIMPHSDERACSPKYADANLEEFKYLHEI